MTTYDPYDVWKTKIGTSVKRNYYLGGMFYKGVAGAVYLTDFLFNNRLRVGYQKQEYAIVRALAAQILHFKYSKTGNSELLDFADYHIRWLINNHLKSENGIGWGLDFEHPVSAEVVYAKNTPFSTITPYILEAIISHENLTNKRGTFSGICELIFNFFDKDLKVLECNGQFEVTSYGPLRDRRVVNSVSYTMYSLVILDKYFKNKLGTADRVSRLYNYVKTRQLEDGSWYYSDEGDSFIDCFHSCIILKNLIKSKLCGVQLDNVDTVISRGYSYIKQSLRDDRNGLYKRFSKTKRPGLIRYDLYDNAEMLQCAVLMNDNNEAKKIIAAIKNNFIEKNTIYSSIDIFGKKQNPGMLRWAIMPYLYSLSLFEAYESKN